MVRFRNHLRRLSPLACFLCVSLGLADVGLGGTKDVTVVNPADDPALVEDVDNPARQPFQRGVTVTNEGPPVSIGVPFGRRLVIRFVSASCDLSQGVPMHSVRITTNVDHFFVPTVFPTGASTAVGVITHPATVYAEPDTDVDFVAFPTTGPGNGTTTCNLSISGYLIEP
jgi:hypothetical protein